MIWPLLSTVRTTATRGDITARVSMLCWYWLGWGGGVGFVGWQFHAALRRLPKPPRKTGERTWTLAIGFPLEWPNRRPGRVAAGVFSWTWTEAD